MNEIDDTYRPVAKIVVIGVGGAGNNAVNRMIDEGLKDVEFYVANTDRQTLNSSKTKNRLILGYGITGGLGAGGEPSVGREAANDSIEDIRQVVKGANMVFIAAGMGGGTGTGAAPIIAQVAKEENALVVAIVTRPFTFEGKKRIAHSVEGLNELKDAVDAIIIVSNDKLLMLSGTQSILSAFAESDAVL
ncbi:MAG: cell division protein FtsZ, partial [Bacilli bacterium]|nr:cell division protein FtsZ [Bacilli bacterium]